MASASRVKPEPGIKPDPEDATASPAALSDDDLYEDAGDLEFYDKDRPDSYAGKIYLTHVPKYLYDSWAHLDDDAEIRIGTVRQWNETAPNGQVKVGFPTTATC
jgi:transcription initiation factor TFIIF subunit beta